ncbi:MAG: ZIP family metal transporter [Alistipes sp.]|nr:ZIP family metal transporter [Alistipes sp.]
MIILMPFIGTLIGSSSAIFLGERVAARMQNTLLGFAAGVMVAASVWSLLIPSINEAEAQGIVAWVPALVGFMAGILFMLLLDMLTPHLHPGSNTPEGVHTSLGRSTMLMLAVTLHNIPEGMAVGVVVAGALSGEVEMSMAGAAALSLGIALQNIPEGAIISLPLRASGNSRLKSLAYGTASGVVEPIAAGITIVLIEHLIGIFPYLLAFAAGAMIYVVVEELIPESKSGAHSNLSTIGFAVGFAAMMVLDIALG